MWVKERWIQQLKNELELVNYQITFIKDGRSFKDLLDDYVIATTKITELENVIEELRESHRKQLGEERKKNRELTKNLRRQEALVIKPMLVEIKVKDEIARRLKLELERNLKDIKMLNTILKVPTMCQEF